jgi:cytochrome c5
VMLEHTVNGYNGMPPLGACMDCSEKEFEALIRFMAGLEPG